MTRFTLRAAALGAVLLTAAPVLAQTPPPPPPAAGMAAGPEARGGRMNHRGPFASMSEAGRKTMWEAMRGDGERKEERAAVKAARDRMLAVLDADRLDTTALKRAMDDERNAANAGRERRQSAMLAAFGKLSVADRKAFVADSRELKSRMESRMKDWRSKRPMRGMGGRDGVMPPPPPAL